jgi:hypothetical protein
LKLSYDLLRIKRSFLLDSGSIQISDGVGEIPFIEIGRYLQLHNDAIDFPLCLVMRIGYIVDHSFYSVGHKFKYIFDINFGYHITVQAGSRDWLKFDSAKIKWWR